MQFDEDIDPDELPNRSVGNADGRVRRAARSGARLALLVALCVAVLWQGSVSVAAVATVTALVGLAWLFALPAVPHKPPQMLFAWPWLGLGAYTALQVVPLPRGLVALVHGRAVELADAGRAALGLEPVQWLPIALAPGDAALQGAVYLVAGAAAALTGLVLMGSNGRDMVRTLSLTLIGLAVLSGTASTAAHQADLLAGLPESLILQLEAITFVNPNHQAALLNLGVALALGQVVNSPNPRHQTVYGMLATMLALEVLLVGSRGGVLVLCLVLALTVLALPAPPKYLRRDAYDQWLTAQRRLGSIVATLLLLGAIVALPAVEKEFFETADPTGELKMRAIVRLPELLAGNWLFGMGPGGLPVVAGLDPSTGTARFDFAENIVAQRLIDMGVLPGLAFLAGLGMVAWSFVRRAAMVPGSRALLVGAGSVVAANFVDFSLEVAGMLVPVALAATLGERLLPLPPRKPMSRRDTGDRYKHTVYKRILIVAGVGLALATVLLFGAARGLTRRAPALLEGHSVATSRELIGEHFLYDHHAFYLHARRLLELEGEEKAARAALDRAISLRPDSKHARLFRFATLLELGDADAAARDLAWLTHADRETFERALRLAARSPRGEAALHVAIQQKPDRSLEIAMLLAPTRPDLVERLALTLRQREPARRYGIELIRGRLYLARGEVAPARRIAAALMADPRTRLQGYQLEGDIQMRSGQFWTAHHLYRTVCDELPDHFDSCYNAIVSLLNAQRPAEALTYVRSRWPQMRDTPVEAGLYWRAVGRAQMQLERYEDALESARTAHGLLRDDLEAALMLVQCLLQVGQHGEARGMLDRLRQGHPDNAEVKRLWGEVASLRPSAI